MSVLLTYLNRVREIKESGIASLERSYYPALDTLFNTLGATLSPKVLAIHDISDQGSGHPDYALQVDGTHDLRAVIEAKPANIDVTVIMLVRPCDDSNVNLRKHWLRSVRPYPRC